MRRSLGSSRPVSAILLLLAFAPGAGATPLATPLRALPTLATVDVARGERFTPDAIAADALGQSWILDRTRGRLLLLSDAQGIVSSFAATGLFGTRAEIIADMAGSGTYLYLLAPSSQQVVILDLAGRALERIGLEEAIRGAGEDGFVSSRLLVGFTGTLWLLSTREGEILRFDRRGRFEESLFERVPEARRPRRIVDAAVTHDESLLLLDAAGPAVTTVASNGVVRDPLPLGDPLEEPACLAVGRDGAIYVTEASGRVRVLRPGEAMRTVVTGESFAGNRALRSVVQDSILIIADPVRERLARWVIAR